MGNTYQLMSLSSAISGSLISAVWESVVLVFAVALLLRLFPKMSAAARSVTWTMVLLLLIGLHIGAAFAVGPQAIQPVSHSGFHLAPVHMDMRWGLVIMSAWLLFSLTRIAQLLMSAVNLRQIARRAAPLRAGFLPEETFDCYRRAEICVSNDVERPCVAGFFSPRVLLPSSLLETLSPSDMTQIILHEMEHLRRADDWTNLLQKISLALFPLNPALLWVERRLCLERELACDDRVLHTTMARKAYAACLVNLAEHSLLQRGISLALGAWERQSELTRRVHRILSGSKDAMGTRPTKIVTGLLAAGLLCGAYALAHSPALVSFTPAPYPEAIAAANHIAPAGHIVPSAKIVEAAYRVPVPAPTLVKADALVRTEQASSAKPKSALKPHKRMKTTLQAISQKRLSSSASWIVLTEWHESSSTRAHAEFIPLSYAAVPTPDGWLIIQL